MLAAKQLDQILGVDVHMVVIAGVPAPIPHPFIGKVFDLMAYLPIIGTTVYVNGKPAAQAGTEVKALPPHIPLGGPFAPPLPGNEGEIFMGSATVRFDGAPQSRMGSPVLTCSSIGMPAPPRKGKSPGTTLLLPTSSLIAIPAGNPVMIGGPPTVDIVTMAFHAISLAGKAFKRFKSAKQTPKNIDKIDDLAPPNRVRKPDAPGANFAGKSDGALPPRRSKPPSSSSPPRNNAARSQGCSLGHPVDAGTGKVYTERVDFSLPGPIPLVWERVYYSTSADYAGPLGHGWHHAYDLRLRRGAAGHTYVLRLADGREAHFPRLLVGQRAYLLQEKLTLERTAEKYLVTDEHHRTHEFAAGPVDGGSSAPLARIATPAGAEILFGYDHGGVLSRIVDSAGRELSVETAGGRITAVYGPHPKHGGPAALVRFAYDAAGDLVASYDQLDHRFSYVYHNHLLTKETDRNGLSFRFEYDGDDQHAWCTRTWGTDGIHDNRIAYDKENRITTVVNSLGARTIYHADRDGLITKTVDPLGRVSRTRYGRGCLPLWVADELGRITKFSYDARGHVTRVDYPDGTAVELSYAGHDLVLATDQNGKPWSWRYNAHHQLVERTNCEGESTAFEYTGPDLTALTDPLGNRSELGYDAGHQLSELRGADGTVTRWTYDVLGRPVAVRLPTGATEERKYNLRGDLLKVVAADGNVSRYRYDGEENPVWSKDRHREVRLEYTGMSRLAARTENGTRVEFSYDTEEDLRGIINEDGYAYRFERDALGRVVAERAFDGLAQTYVRDPAGQVVAVVKPGGGRTEYDLDAMGRTVGVNYPDGAKHTFTYRADGQLLGAVNADAELRYERDDLGRITAETCNGVRIDSRYDKYGNRTRVESSLGTKSRFHYDKLGTLQRVSSAGEDRPDWSAGFRHDHLGLEIERQMPGGVRTKYHRDRTGRVARQETSVGGRLSHTRAYDWDVAGRLRSLTINHHERFAFEHDAVGNLAAATYPSGRTDYRLPDAVGNLYRSKDRRDRAYNPAGQILRSGPNTYLYDADGNLVERVVREDEVRPGDEGTWRYRWNGAGMLTEVLRPDRHTVSFTYDALGRRLSKAYRDKTTYWAWDGNVPLHEWTVTQPGAVWDGVSEGTRLIRAGVPLGASPANARAVAVTSAAKLGKAEAAGRSNPEELTEPNDPTDPDNELDRAINELVKQVNVELNTYLFEPGTFTPLAKFTPTRQLSVVSDHLGTPAALYDGAGELVWQNRMDIYGRPLWTDGLAADMWFRYPGQYEDNETGLSYNRFRYYDAGVGCYISRDPIGLAGGNPTLYGYVGDVNGATDVFGLWENIPSEDLSWTAHGNKHKAPKGKTWKDTINSTKNGPAKYVPGLDIETFERDAWDRGTPVANGKTWKVFDVGETIGAKNGKSTTFVRIELSANTIHGHPIQESEYKKLIKPKSSCPK